MKAAQEILVAVGNLIANSQYEIASKKLTSYLDWRAKGGEQPIIVVSGKGVEGDIVCQALQKTIDQKGGFALLLTILNAERGIENG